MTTRRKPHRTPTRHPTRHPIGGLFLYRMGHYDYVVASGDGEHRGLACGWLEGAIHLLVVQYRDEILDLALMVDPDTCQIRRSLVLSSDSGCPDPTLTDPLDRFGLYEAMIAVRLGLGVAP